MCTVPLMAPAPRRPRTRGTIDRLPSGAYQVRIYAGTDPVTGKRHDLVEVVPAGRRAAAEAEKVRTRLLSQLDERRNPRMFFSSRRRHTRSDRDWSSDVCSSD